MRISDWSSDVCSSDLIAAAESIRDRLAAMDGGTIAVGFARHPKEPGAVRGGPLFEFLFGIDTLLRRPGRRARFELVFFHPEKQPRQRLGPAAVAEVPRRDRKNAVYGKGVEERGH